MQPQQNWPNKKLNIATLNNIKVNGPTLVMEEASIKAQYEALKNSLPGVKIHYAVKCNPEEKILKLLKDAGSSFEIASQAELDRLIAIGVDPKEAIYSNTIKIPSHVKNTFKKGLRRYSLDSPGEIKKIAQNAPGSEIYVRVQVSNHGSVIPLASKFGASPSHVIDLIELAQDFGLKPIGLAFHVGSQAENIQLWGQAFSIVSSLFKQAKERGIDLTVLNIGGGFPVQYAMSVPSIKIIGQHIQSCIKKYNLSNLEICAEPGRFLVAEAGVMISTVIGREVRGNREWVYLDIGRFNGLAELFESEDLKYPVKSSKDLMKNNERLLKEVTLTGPTCDSFDTIFHGVPVNSTVETGDRIYFGTAGAYTQVYSSAFNDFPQPKVMYL